MAGIKKETAKNILINDATIYLNLGIQGKEKILGFTTQANFVVEREIKNLAEEYASGPVKGFDMIQSEIATISGELGEITTTIIKSLLPGSEVVDWKENELGDVTHDQITSTLQIVDEDYIENIAAVGTLNGTRPQKKVICLIENALNLENFTLNTSPKSEAKVPFSFRASYHPEQMEKVPYKIRYPKATA